MSTAEILSLISLISYIIAGVAAVLAVFFWFFFKIPSVIGDLSGRTAKKSIARKRASNERSGGRGYQPSATNANRGKITETMQPPHNPKSDSKKGQPIDERRMPETGLLETNKAACIDSHQTELLNDETSGFLVDKNATVALQEEPTQIVKRTGGKKLIMLEDIMLIHTDEVIA